VQVLPARVDGHRPTTHARSRRRRLALCRRRRGRGPRAERSRAVALAPVHRALIIVPALNEEESLPATLKELREVVPDHDVVVIDDGSSDATAEVARRAGAVAAELPFTLGVGGAVRTGLHYAQEHAYQRAVVIDA